MTIEILSREDYHGCELRKERLTGEDAGLPEGESMEWEMVYAPDGGLVGPVKEAYVIIVEKGIMPQRRRPDLTGCSVGYAKRDQRWYGWSHRAAFGFAVGDLYFNDFTDHARTVRRITTLGEARYSAYQFAKAVSG